MIDYKFFTDFQKELFTEHGYMLDKLNNSTSFWFFNKREGKKSYRDVYAHNYYLHYAKRFQSKRNTALKILEIGVFKGFSLLLWQRYFPNAEIYGIDIDLSSSFRGKSAKELLKDEKRIHLSEFDAADKKKVDEFVKENGADFDIIIEDGSHLGHHQILSTLYFMPLLKKDGIMVIEDIGLYYGAGNESYMVLKCSEKDTRTQKDVEREKEFGMPIFDYFMANYKDIENNSLDRFYPFLINKDNVKLIENIKVEYEQPIDAEVIYTDMDLEGRSFRSSCSATSSIFGNAKLAFLTYKN